MEEQKEDEITLATPGVIDKYQAAGAVANCISIPDNFLNETRCFGINN